MKCNYCGEGGGRNYTKDKKTGMIYYYYCQKCVSDFTNPNYFSDVEKQNIIEEYKRTGEELW